MQRYQIEIETDRIEDVKSTLSIVCKVIETREIKETRTTQQNKSLHLFFEQLAEAMNEKHCDMRMIIRKDIEIEWSKETVKEFIWKPLQNALYGKKSTTELLKTQEIDKIYDYIVKIISERSKGEVIVPEWPSDEFYR